MGGFEISLIDKEFLGFDRVLSEIHSGLLQDCGTPHLSDEEGAEFPIGP